MANKFTKNDEAVSAVIGVILMVAITVILAAVIAAFVFGMGSSIKKTYVVSFTIDRAANGHVIITNTGGQDISKLAAANAINVTVDGTQITTGGTVVNGAVANLGTVGNSVELSNTGSPTNHVVVTGTFADGTKQVLSTADI